MKHVWLSCGLIAILAACTAEYDAPASDSPAVSDQNNDAETISSDRPAAAVPTTDKVALFGDLHIHTKNSFDAYIFNVRSTPDDVYRFAKGETVRHPSGFDIKIWGEPLDFVAATDHGAYMGILPQMDNPDSPLYQVEMAKNMFGTDPALIVGAFQKIGASVRSGVPYEEVYDREIIDNTWQSTVASANRHYKPGTLTTFAAYEYTAVSQGDLTDATFAGGNLHRNVVFKDAAPTRVFSTLDSVNPEDLWDWMDAQRAEGRDVLAIPHNSNVSDGLMFDLVDFDGRKMTAETATQRVLNEPIVEITQVKGTSETHPALSPNDEYADFEIYEKLLASQITSKINGSYVREALGSGIAIQKQTGANPYKFGFIGSSDTHVAGGAFDEKDYWSKVGIIDGTAEARGSIPPNGAKTWDGIERNVNAEDWFSKWGASGLAGVWAYENTREGVFDAMRAKETFATSGPRIKIRLFASHDYDASMMSASDLIAQAYANGTAMGGTVTSQDRAPSILVWASRDPLSAPLQRLQIIKVWHDGVKTQERIYDVACADGSTPDATTNRCQDNGATVNLATCAVSDNAGIPDMKALWQDPEYDPTISVSYYARVLENPTCRWSTWDALRAGVVPHPDLPATIQERAWSSPIWVEPAR